MPFLDIPKPGKLTTTYPDGSVSSELSTVYEYSQGSVKSAKRTSVKVNGWREPLPYSIWGNSGDVWTCEVSGRATSRSYVGVSPDHPDGYAYWQHARSGSISNGSQQPLSSVPNYLYQNALIKARLKLKELNINLPQAFAERDQVARLVGDSCLRLVRLMKAFRGGKHWEYIAKNARGKTLAQLWLEAQYGWKPLYSDVFGAAETLRRHLETEVYDFRTHVSSRMRDFKVEDLAGASSVGPLRFHINSRRETTYDCKVRLDFERSGLDIPNSMKEIGVTNPLYLAWELTPFSFVADWFVPIGDWLSSLDASVGWTFKSGSVSKKVVGITTHQLGRITNIGPNLSGYVTVLGKGRQFSFDRSVFASEPYPDRPHFKESKSVIHMLNGIALLQGAVRVR